jgi:hypothetical protein
VANKLFAMLRDPDQKVSGWENPPYTSFTSGYRAPEYSPDEEDDKYLVYALKTYPMSPNSNEISMQIVRNYILKARDLVVEELLKECKEEFEFFDESIDVKTKIRTPDNWYGDNERIPLKYLKSSGTESIDGTLRNNPFCSHLSDDQLKELISSGKTKTIEAGTVIILEGEKANKVYLIIEGKVKVYKKDRSGFETELATIEKGNIFGEMALFDKGVRSACVKTIEPSKFLIFNGDKFLEMSLG